MSWINEIIEKDLKRLNQEKNDPGWFSVAAISNVPLISFPELSNEECVFIHEQAQEVLRISRNKNKFQETAITFCLSDLRNVLVTLGDYKTVLIFDDPDVRALIESSNESGSIVICTHNHTNNTPFSLNDMYVFSENKSILLMMILNSNGEISFLMRPKGLDLSGIVSNNLYEVIPDIEARVRSWNKDNPDTEYKLTDISSITERKKTAELSIKHFIQNGVEYSPYINQTEADKLSFKRAPSGRIQKDANKSLIGIKLMLDEEIEYEYEENEED